MPELEPEPNPLSRIELLRLAQGLGVVDADVMTRAELRTAIEKAQQPEPPTSEHQPVTWVSVARRLLASVVERGLNLPDAAALIRGDTKLMAPPKAPPPVATVTLARIYAAQGHVDRAIATLDEVLESDPDHELARELRRQLELRRAELLARQGALATPSATRDERDAPRTPPAPTPPLGAAVDAPLASDSADSAGVAQAMTDAAAASASAAASAEAAAAEAASADIVATTEALAAAATDAASTEEAAAKTATDVSAATPLDPPDRGANGIANGTAPPAAPLPSAALSAPEPPAALPRVPGLLLIETDSPIRYVYWELTAAGLGAPYWIHVVTHTPTGRGDTERRERAFPVHRELGALRLEGVPRQAIVRAKLTHRPNDGRPLVVAGSVRPRPRGGGDSFEVRYAPHAKAKPEALARRAKALLDGASPVYWDS